MRARGEKRWGGGLALEWEEDRGLGDGAWGTELSG